MAYPGWHPLGEAVPDRPEKAKTDLVVKGKPGQKRRFTQAEVIEALKESRGLMGLAAKRLGCSYQMVHRYCKDFPAVQDECTAQRELFVDTMQLQLYSAGMRGEQWAIQMVLRTLGRARGFSERTEITGKDGGPIEHAHIHLWEERLQAVHNAMAEKKAALLLERGKDGSYGEPVDTA